MTEPDDEPRRPLWPLLLICSIFWAAVGAGCGALTGCATTPAPAPEPASNYSPYDWADNDNRPKL